jgi:hypothetical protein
VKRVALLGSSHWEPRRRPTWKGAIKECCSLPRDILSSALHLARSQGSLPDNFLSGLDCGFHRVPYFNFLVLLRLTIVYLIICSGLFHTFCIDRI